MPKYSSTSDVAVGGNKFLKANDDGWFHMFVTASREGGVKHNGSPLDNAMFQITCEVLAATKEDCIGKTWDTTVYYPKPGSKDGGAFQGKIVDRFLLAMAVYKLKQLLDSQDRDFDADKDLVGRQFIVKLKTDKGSDDKEYIGVDGAHIYHPDDPAVADQPKNADYLKPAVLPAARRLTDDEKKQLVEMGKAKAKPPGPESVAAGGKSVASI